MVGWIGHVLRHDGLWMKIIEGRIWGKPTTGRRRIQTLHDLANDGGFVTLKRAAEDRERHTQRKDVNNVLYSRRLLMMTPGQAGLAGTWISNQPEFLAGGANRNSNATVTTTIRLRFDGRSTSIRRPFDCLLSKVLKSHWHIPFATVTLTYLLTQRGRSSAARS